MAPDPQLPPREASPAPEPADAPDVEGADDAATPAGPLRRAGRIAAAALGLGLLGGTIQWLRMAGGPGATRGPVRGLALRVFPPAHRGADDPATTADPADTLVVFLTSDAGWSGLNVTLPPALADSGHPTVAWNSLRYYTRERDPDGAARDLERLLAYAGERFGTRSFALVGYSWGAGVLPFLVNRLTPAWRDRLRSVVYLAYPGVASFRFHPSAWMLRIGEDALPAADEVSRMPRVPSLCVAGEHDPIRACASLEPFGVERRLLPVGHSLTGQVDELLPHVLATLGAGAREDVL